METIVKRCAGLDVHLETVVACVRVAEGGSVSADSQVFGTTFAELLRLGDWLVERGVTEAAMEATGVYWKPVWNLLEGRVKLMLVNARHVRNVPGRKTDINDAQWLAQLLQAGLLSPSFVPDRPQRELRDLTRHRTTLMQDRARVINRVQKVLEDANIKLSSVASDVMGVSGRLMIRALADGESDPKKLANLAKMQLRKKIPRLIEALRGGVNEHHRRLLRMLMDQIEFLDGQLAELTGLIEAATAADEETVERLDTIPGVDRAMAQVILAEVGRDMSRFPTAAHLCSWATLCPGNHESAGKRKKGTTRRGNRWLKGGLTQSAWAASRTKGTYLSAMIRRTAHRRGYKRAIVAAGHSILTSVYYILRDDVIYQDLGPDYLAKMEPERLTRSLVKRLEQLGHKVVLEAAA
jgi:transposase